MTAGLAAELAKAADLWGPDADVAVESTGTVHSGPGGRGPFHDDVRVRCLNYGEISK